MKYQAAVDFDNSQREAPDDITGLSGLQRWRKSHRHDGVEFRQDLC